MPCFSQLDRPFCGASYLTAGQLSDLLGHVGWLYDALYDGMTHSGQGRMGLQSRLRASEMRAGNSLELLLAAGVAAVIRGGAIVTVPAE